MKKKNPVVRVALLKNPILASLGEEKQNGSKIQIKRNTGRVNK